MTDITIAALRAEVERLTGERDRQYDQNAEQIIRIAALEAENERLKKEALFTAISVLPEKDADNERLRAALREIAEENIGNTAAISVYIARAALEGKP